MSKTLEEINTDILEQLVILSANVKEQTALLKSMDWKVWTTLNVVCDTLNNEGRLAEDPRGE